MLRALVVSVVVALLASCGASVPPAGMAREQPPQAGSPPVAWRSTQGRCLVSTPFSRLSCRLLVKHGAAGALRLTMLADEGPLLLDAEQVGDVVTVHSGHPDLLPRAGMLIGLAVAAWGDLPSATPEWSSDHWLVRGSTRTVHLGGDPLLPRVVDAGGLAFAVGDYRWTAAGLLAHRASLTAPGVEVTLTLGTDADASLQAKVGSGASSPP